MSGSRGISPEHREAMERWVEDPELFALEVFPSMPPREAQGEFLRAVSRKKSVAEKAARGAGKTVGDVYAAKWFFLTRIGALVVWISPTRQQADHARNEAASMWQKSRGPLLFPSFEFLADELRNPADPVSKIKFVTAESGAEFLAGFHAPHVMVILDEARAISREVFESAQGMVPNPTDKVIATSTPGSTSGWFYDAWSRDRAFWGAHLTVRAEDVERLREKRQEMIDRYGRYHPVVLTEWDAEFASDTENPFFPLNLVEPAIGRDLFDSDSIASEFDDSRVVGCDPARFGKDKTAVVARYGRKIVEVTGWEKKSLTETCGLILETARRHTATDIVIDSVGIGSGLFDFLQEHVQHRRWPTTVHDFNAGAKPPDEESRSANLKTWVGFEILRLLQKGMLSLPDHATLITQMIGEQMTIQSNGKVRMKDPAGSPSPDFLDALILSFGNSAGGPSVVGLTSHLQALLG